MERTVLNSLGFRINTPTAYTFWSVYRLGHAMHNPTASLASYLMVRWVAFLVFDPRHAHITWDIIYELEGLIKMYFRLRHRPAEWIARNACEAQQQHCPRNSAILYLCTNESKRTA